jgi:hypothetical protein
MNSKLLGIVLMTLAAGGTGAVSVYMIQSLDTGLVQADGGPTAQQLASVQRQLEDIAGAQDEISRRIQQVELELLRGAQNDRAATPILTSPESVADLKEHVTQLDKAFAQMGASKGAGMFTIEDVGAALEEIRAQEESDRDAGREEQRAERLAERLAEVAKELGLDSYQQQQLAVVAAEATEARNEIFNEIRESGDWNTLRDSIEAGRSAFDTTLSAFLSTDQFTSFSEMGGLGSLSGGGYRGSGGGRNWGGGRGR